MINSTTTFKYIHLVETEQIEQTLFDTISKDVLPYITSYTTYLTKSLHFKDMNNLEHLKIYLSNKNAINSKIFDGINGLTKLKTVIIDARYQVHKKFIQSLLSFNTFKVKFIILFSDLNDIIIKQNVQIACTNGNSKVSEMLSKDYIPLKRNNIDLKAFNDFIIYSSLSINKCYFQDRTNEYFLYDIDCLSSNNWLNLYTKTLPINVVINISKKSKSSAIHINEINLINSSGINYLKHLALINKTKQKKLVNVSLPQSIQQVYINGDNFNIITPNIINELYYVNTNNIQTNFMNITSLTIDHMVSQQQLNLSTMSKLQYCHIQCKNNVIVFPKHKLLHIELICNEFNVRNSFTSETVLIQNPTNLTTLNVLELTSLKLSNCKGIEMIDFRKYSSLTNLELLYEPCINNLPTSLITLKYMSSNVDSNSQRFIEMVSNITNLQKLKIEPQFISLINHLINLTSLKVIYPNPYPPQRLFYNLNYKDLSYLTKLKDISFESKESLPTFPNSITQLELNFDGITSPLENIHLDYLFNLQNLTIMYIHLLPILPTSLTYLKIYTSSDDTLNLLNIPIKQLSYNNCSFKNSKQLQLPTSLESLDILISNPINMKLPDLTKTTNLTHLCFQFGDFLKSNYRLLQLRDVYNTRRNQSMNMNNANPLVNGTMLDFDFDFVFTLKKKSIHLGPWYLPSSLEVLLNKCDNNRIYITYQNVEHTQLKKYLKKLLQE